jgi:NAD(P)-dependent dehydrogenase (short-subunit alcohol dehydrogenase family)
MTTIDGARVIITGSGGGIGLRIAEVFRDAGAQVLVSDISDQALALARKVGFEAVACDVGDEEEVHAFLEEGVARLGGLDVLVNNAGVAGPTGPVEQLDSEQWRQTFDVNIHGQFYGVKHALPHLRRSRSPRIINLSSAAGRLGMAGRTPYSASKWAVIGFTKSLANELGPEGITVNAICPGAVDGPRIRRVIESKAQMLGTSAEEVASVYRDQAALRRMVTVEDVAQMALFLAGPGARNVSGQAIAVDGHTEKLT